MALFKLISVVVILSVVAECRGNYYGKLIGEFVRRGDSADAHHNVAGTVYAVDDDTLQIIGFTYDGTAPDAFFYIGTSGTPSANGYVIPKAVGLGSEKLGEYSNADLTIHIDATQGPGRISDYAWISVWCRTAGVNFADVIIPSGFTPPEEYSLGTLGFRSPRYGVTADDVIILNSKQIRFVGLNYDGRGPAVYFWMDTQDNPTSRGTIVPQVGESSASRLNQRLSGVTRTVHLPGGTTVFDIRSIGLWCRSAGVSFGHVTIPQNLGSRGVIIPFVSAPDEQTYDNCEVLKDDEYQVSWTIDGDYIAIGLASRQSVNEYMAFGPSGSDSQTTMVESDVIVAYIDSETSMARVEDYYLSALAMCTPNNGMGVCPDTLASISDPGTNNVTLSGYSTDNGITRINFRRPLIASDQFDRAINTVSQYISWALGPINDDGRATYHGPENRTPGDKQINFGQESSACPAFTMRTDDDGFESFEVEPIKALEDTEFRCDIGLAGGPKGYQGITGTVGWGIAWYINGNLIPEITVKRNQTYTFKVYGGLNPNQSASYHPFYITTDPAGGYDQLPPSARGSHQIIAGPANGSYCIYEETAATPNQDDTDSYQAYRDTLQLSCPNGDDNPGTLVWTPDVNTPDLVFYQCYTHRFLGWKIHVTDDANKCVLSLITMVTAIITAILIMFTNA